MKPQPDLVKPIPVSQVTDALMKDFFQAYWQECGSKDVPYMIESYINDAIRTFRYGLDNKTGYIDGTRWDIMTHENGLPTGIWPHVKVRYKVEDAYDGRPFTEWPFVFVVYVNAISNKQMYPRVQAAVKALVEKLAATYPVVAEL